MFPRINSQAVGTGRISNRPNRPSSGRILLSKVLPEGRRMETVDLTSFGKGIYFVTARSRNEAIRTKFTVE